MGGTVTLAGSSMENTYHRMFDTILSSSAGTVLTNIGLAAAVILALGLIGGGICKALGRQNKLVQMFCPTIGRVLVILAVGFILAGPTVTIPAILKMLDWFVDALGGSGKSYLGI
ncbi:hypothetical protein [Bifidobacterium catenulatum]|uniref:Uncharacterized protein n=1 Tax=Bifidobacterium catenulatum subsp. kashiwanohense TaxID=630129 RepID=A0AA43P4R4_9BIFI|nr:hypothetical protein [Bifidobacterium catenulatum]MDH7889202.1 hypothetical protein [Bifidobacterium catenulatum subsp. kashiwanohense]